jgi:multicomponent K+:H+ antiporter subunit A
MSFVILPVFMCAIGAAIAGVLTTTGAGNRISSRALGWLLAIAPTAAFGLVINELPGVLAGNKVTAAFEWLPTLGIRFAFLLDGLSALFALLVTGIGALILIYAGYYFAPKHGAHKPSPNPLPKGDGFEDTRFLFYLLLFMTSMLGLVLAGDVMTLFLFWEGTSITSFLLVAYKSKDEVARKGAFKALFITGGGGIALLAGLLFVSAISGSSDLQTILKNGDALRAHAWYPVMLALVAIGAFTKSAQVPAHIWLPNAMSAPTPASAYLHSATMVKAGVYLLARMYPALGGTEMWFWLLTSTGAITMLLGAVLGLKQYDLKAVLAYSTISQLGVLVMLIGQPDGAAFKALVIGVVAHALYKGALFLVAGIVDHETGTRDLRKLGGLWRAMPATFVIGGIVALSAAGLPPLFGFLAKETLLAAVTEHALPGLLSIAIPVASVVMGALMLAQAGTLILDTFVTKPGAGWPFSFIPTTSGEESVRAHEAPAGMLVGPGVLALLSLVIALLPIPAITDFFAKAAEASFGEKVKVSLALWTGINTPLILSLIAISSGIVIFLARKPVRSVLALISESFTVNRIYDGVLALFDRGAWLATRTQAGRIRYYLLTMLVTMIVLIGLFGGVFTQFPSSLSLAANAAVTQSWTSLNVLRFFSLLLIVAASLVSVVIKRDLFAIVALGASGLAMAILIALEPSPDVALVQVVVDILTTVVLVLALSRLPRDQREKAELNNARHKTTSRLRDLVICGISGFIVFSMCLFAFGSRPRNSIVTPYYEENSKPLTGAADIVGAIVVDFRGFDTMIEITVFSMAGIGVYTLLRHAMKKRETELVMVEASKQVSEGVEEPTGAPAPQLPPTIRGIDGVRTSPFVRALAYAALPLSIVIALIHMIYGHDQPGDGFTAGVVLSLAVAFWYVVFGYAATKQRLRLWPPGLIGAGILTVMIGSIAPVFLGGTFFSPFDFGLALGLPLPKGFYLSTSFLFEIAICLSVLGSATFIVDTLGHPERDME